MNLFIVIITVIYTILYGFLCKYFWISITLCQDCFIFLVINSLAAVVINTVFFIAVKYEIYELISGYDKNKNYDNKILKNYLKKLLLIKLEKTIQVLHIIGTYVTMNLEWLHILKDQKSLIKCLKHGSNINYLTKIKLL